MTTVSRQLRILSALIWIICVVGGVALGAWLVWSHADPQDKAYFPGLVWGKAARWGGGFGIAGVVVAFAASTILRWAGAMLNVRKTAE